MTDTPRPTPKRLPAGSYIVLGVLVGSVLGLLLDNFGMWLAVGVMAGSVVDGALLTRRRHDR